MIGIPDATNGSQQLRPPTLRRVAPGRICFADVADPDVMLAAINQAKSALCVPVGGRARQASVDRVGG
jgi:hypothetical protein